MPDPTTTTTQVSPGPNMNEAFESFDALVKAPETEQAPTEPTEPEDKGPTTPPEETTPKPPAKETTPPKTETTPKVDPAKTPPQQTGKEKAVTLREKLDKSIAEITEWKTKYEKLAAEKPAAKTADPEKEQLLKDREDWNKRREELENELKFTNYERSGEYQEKYQKPFLTAYEQGQKLIQNLSMKEPDTLDELGAVMESGKTRKGTPADWDKLMSIQDEDAANKFIAENFGHNAARITLQREKVLEMHSQMRNALDDFRKNASQRETLIKTESEKFQKETSDRWHMANTNAAAKYPEYFAPDPADQKGNELLTHGQRLTDLGFGILDPADVAKLPKEVQSKMVNGKLPQAELTLLHAAIRNRSAAYDRLVYRNQQKDAELKALKEKLDGYEKSEPNGGTARKTDKTGKKQTPGSWAEIDAEFDKMAGG